LKRTNILFFIAAATLCLSLCGMFFYEKTNITTVSTPTVSNSEVVNTDFSKEFALEQLALCSLAYSEEDIRSELSDRGYTNIEYTEKEQDTNYSNGIAFSTAFLKNDNVNYLSVVIRGTNGKEWYSNFQIGENVEHAGFSAASDFVISETDKYLEKHNIDKANTIVQITGHSRGAAVANICAKRLIQSEDYLCISAYTFATPNTTTDTAASDPAYSHIYNIINPEDFICCIPPEIWNYRRYGTDIYLPQKGDEDYSSLYSSMQDKFFELTQSSHKGYPDGDRDVKRFIEAISEISPTVHDYYNKEITLFPQQVTMYEYMQSAAALLCGEQSMSDGMILLSSGTSPVFSAFSEFIMQGIDIESIKDADITSGAIGCAHIFDTYRSWIEILDEDYFTNITEPEKSN